MSRGLRRDEVIERLVAKKIGFSRLQLEQMPNRKLERLLSNKPKFEAKAS